MKQNVGLFVIIAFALAGAACAQEAPSPLVVHARAESLPPNNKGDKIEITFYADGLIRTFQDSYTNPNTGEVTIETKFRVDRGI